MEARPRNPHRQLYHRETGTMSMCRLRDTIDRVYDIRDEPLRSKPSLPHKMLSQEYFACESAQRPRMLQALSCLLHW